MAADLGMDRSSRPDKAKAFPLSRALIAFVLVPFLTVFVSQAIQIATQQRSVDQKGFQASDLYMLPLFAILYAWPVYVAFGILGIPTAYFLYRANRTDYLTCAIFGMLYAGATFIVAVSIGQTNHDALIENLRGLPPIAVNGILAGTVTRLIIFGWR